jgi:hypothetical protein
MHRYLLAIFATLSLGLTANANVFTFRTDPGSTAGGVNVGASAVFTITGTNSFSITLANIIPSTTSAGQLLTDLQFNFAGQNVTMVSSLGQQETISSNGSVTLGADTSPEWGFGSTGSGSYILCVICGNSGVTASATPTQGIIGTGPFTGSNGSIDGNPAHNPFLTGAVFNFTTSSTLSTTGNTNPFSGASFSFGTTYGNNSPGMPTPNNNVPEPITMMLTGAGLVGISLVKRLRR